MARKPKTVASRTVTVKAPAGGLTLEAGAEAMRKIDFSGLAREAAAIMRKKGAKARRLQMPGGEWQTRERFIEYLEEPLIPDLEESGHNFTAADFRIAVRFMRDEDRE